MFGIKILILMCNFHYKHAYNAISHKHFPIIRKIFHSHNKHLLTFFQLLCVIVENESDIAAFADYTGEADISPPPAPAPAAPAASQPAAPSPPGKDYSSLLNCRNG